ncbi:aldehyde dehydrogenase [Nitritalea halalkaliphila LW7]|uniref:Aldehyde dehydrogenase n=1 Tax=Nitritalea halalkaliphila LW7 TaxID=1189621 RepID=I5CAP8_9BACT|nr:aldehyde dehydrogenase family protein [Nitritalea halalkaliphila]EIM78900.1 aldehyde dehydrogenase [Nitritalea halalkaliphila LW7]
MNFLTFIGSAKVGWYLKSKVAPGTRVALEHGGAAPVLVEEDAAIESIIGPLAKGGFYHAGQVCVSVQRVFVHASQAEAFAEKLAAAGEALVVGDPLEKATEVGPLILPDEVERVAQWVEEAISEGARCLSGGKKIGNTCYAPTVLYNPSPESKVSTEEIFGPVICVYPYTDRAEAIRQANALPYHFQASVFTQHVDKAFSAVRQLNALAVMVNDHTAFRVDWMPFGGRDASGEGIGGIAYSMHEMTRPKLMVIKSPAFE